MISLFSIKVFMNQISSLVKTNDYQIVKAMVEDAPEICNLVNEAFKTDIFRVRPRTSLSHVIEFFDEQHTWFVIKVT